VLLKVPDTNRAIQIRVHRPLDYVEVGPGARHTSDDRAVKVVKLPGWYLDIVRVAAGRRLDETPNLYWQMPRCYPSRYPATSQGVTDCSDFQLSI
jgi:hypothetical protein